MPDDRWTIRGIPEADRKAASLAAGRADVTIADWMARAIRAYVAAEAAEQRAVAAEIFAPGRHQGPALYNGVSDTESDKPTKLDDIARALQLGQMIARLRNRRGCSRALLREAQAALVRELSVSPAPAAAAAADRPPSSQLSPLRISQDPPDTDASSHGHVPAP